MNTRKWKKKRAIVFEIFIDSTTELEKYTSPVICFGYLKYGYCWIFPNTEKIICGIGGLSAKNHKIIPSFQFFLANFDLTNINVSHIKSAFVPLGYYHQIPAANNAVLIGDAGGFVNPFTGEGIYYAQKSGAIAAEAINETLNNAKCFHETYLQLLHSRILPELIKAKKVGNIYYRLTNRVFYVPLKMLLRSFDRRIDQFIHGVQSHNIFSCFLSSYSLL